MNTTPEHLSAFTVGSIHLLSRAMIDSRLKGRPAEVVKPPTHYRLFDAWMVRVRLLDDASIERERLTGIPSTYLVSTKFLVD